MKYRRAFFAVLLVLPLLCAAAAEAGSAPLQAVMRAEVTRLVKAAEARRTLWPWSAPLPEVARVAAYGRPIAPLLVALLADDPDGLSDTSPEVNWNVQQQVALALCKIYGVTEEPGHVYMNRASREENAFVKLFWVRKVVEP